MKKILLLLILIPMLFSGCKFINEKILKKGSDTLEVYAYELEQQLKESEAEYQSALKEIQERSQARIDSIITYYEEQLASGGGRITAPAPGTYYLIVGSFKTPEYAVDYSAKVSDMGYQTEILKEGYWNFVSAESYNNLTDALNGLSIVRSDVTPNAWIYVDR